MRKSPTSVERKGVEKATVLDKVSTTIYEIAITLLELLLVPDQGKSRSYIMQVKIRRIEHQAPPDVRMSDENGRGVLPPNDHLLDETPPRKTPRDRSPVRAPLPSPDPPTPKLVIHAEEKLTNSESDTSDSSNNSSPASSRAASPTKMITRFTQTDTLVSLCGQMHRLRLMYEPVASNNKH